jgi:cell division protein FtsW
MNFKSISARFFKKNKRKISLDKKNRSLRNKNRSEIKKTGQKRQSILRKFIALNGQPNLSILAIVSLFCLGGLLMVFSASAYYAFSDPAIQDTFFYFKRQLIWIAAGTVIGYLFFIVPLENLKKWSTIILGVGVLLLLYILPEALFGSTTADGLTSGLQMPLVEALNGAPRWINLQFFYLQPSELVKFAFVIYLAAWLTKDKISKAVKSFNDHFQTVILPFLFILGCISLMIVLQRDFDTTVVLVLSALTVYYVSGSSKVHTLGSIAIVFFTFILGTFALLIEGYRRARIETFFHIFQYGANSQPEVIQEGGFQVFNGLVGLASGWIAGNGYGESVVKQGYLQQAAYTDSIFSVIGEEFGFFGTLLVTIGFLYFASIGFGIAQRASTKFGAFLAVGMTALIVIQGFLNIAAVAVLIPFGGMPLPFFTYGGSSTIMTLICVGVLLNVSKEKNQVKVRGS